MLLCVAAFAAPQRIRDIDVSLQLRHDGSALVTEVWDVTPSSSNTEWYLVRSNLGDIEIGNLSVTDESGRRFVDEGEWDVDRSLSAKAGRCGIVHKRNGVEICWGIGTREDHVFTVSYTMSNAVKSLRDYDMLHLQLVSPGLAAKPEHVRVSISADGRVDALVRPAGAVSRLNSENTRFWGFGFEGESRLEDGSVIMESTGRIESVIALLRFDKGLFDSPSVQDREFADVLETAMKGADFGDGSQKDPLFARILMALFAILPILLSVAGIVYAAGYKKRILGVKPKEVDWSRDVPFDGNLEDSFYTLARLGENKKGNSYVGALILRMVYKGVIVAGKDSDGKVELSFNDAKAAGLDGISRGLYEMMKEASGSDVILQDKEFSKWSRKNWKRVNEWVKDVSDVAEQDMREKSFLKKSKYTPEGQEKARGLLGFRKFLSDFTLMESRGTREAGLWQEYLVYASLYGIAPQVAKELKDIDPQFFEETMPCDYPTMRGVLVQNNTLANAITNAQARAASRGADTGSWGGFGGSTSFGGGGGFSGGGFGGGGR